MSEVIWVNRIIRIYKKDIIARRPLKTAIASPRETIAGLVIGDNRLDIKALCGNLKRSERPGQGLLRPVIRYDDTDFHRRQAVLQGNLLGQVQRRVSASAGRSASGSSP